MFAYDKMVKKLNEYTKKYMYKGRCFIFNNRTKTVNGLEQQGWEEVARDIPCHLSFGVAQSNEQTATVSKIEKNAVLFLSTDIKVLSGSKIKIMQNEAVYIYYASGEPSIYQTHQEIGLCKEVEA